MRIGGRRAFRPHPCLDREFLPTAAVIRSRGRTGTVAAFELHGGAVVALGGPFGAFDRGGVAFAAQVFDRSFFRFVIEGVGRDRALPGRFGAPDDGEVGAVACFDRGGRVDRHRVTGRAGTRSPFAFRWAFAFVARADEQPLLAFAPETQASGPSRRGRRRCTRPFSILRRWCRLRRESSRPAKFGDPQAGRPFRAGNVEVEAGGVDLGFGRIAPSPNFIDALEARCSS